MGKDGGTDSECRRRLIPNSLSGDRFTGPEATLTISIAGDKATPYRIMDQLQKEMSEAGVLRVVDRGAASSALTLGLEKSTDEGLPMVLPAGAARGDRRGPARPVTGDPGPGSPGSVRNILQMVVVK